VPPTPLARVRSLCRALPGAHEVEAWGEPTFRIKNKIFAMYASAGNHHGQGRPSLWCMATPENQELLVRSRPERFFVPPYVGPSGWIGIYLDRRPAWTEVRELLQDALVLRSSRSKRRAAPRSPPSTPRRTRPGTR